MLIVYVDTVLNSREQERLLCSCSVGYIPPQAFPLLTFVSLVLREESQLDCGGRRKR